MNRRSSQLRRALSDSYCTVSAVNWAPCNECGLEKLYEMLTSIRCSRKCFDACDSTAYNARTYVRNQISEHVSFLRFLCCSSCSSVGFVLDEVSKKKKKKKTISSSFTVIIMSLLAPNVLAVYSNKYTLCVCMPIDGIWCVLLKSVIVSKRMSHFAYRYTLLHYTPQHQRQPCYSIRAGSGSNGVSILVLLSKSHVQSRATFASISSVASVQCSVFSSPNPFNSGTHKIQFV